MASGFARMPRIPLRQLETGQQGQAAQHTGLRPQGLAVTGLGMAVKQVKGHGGEVWQIALDDGIFA